MEKKLNPNNKDKHKIKKYSLVQRKPTTVIPKHITDSNIADDKVPPASKIKMNSIFGDKVKTILDSKNILPKIKTVDKEGVDYINVSLSSSSQLGKMLAPKYVPTNMIDTVFGKIRTVYAGMTYANTKGFPKYLLTKPTIKKSEFVHNSKNRINVPNYWAIIAHLLCARVADDKQLQELLRMNTVKVYTSFDIVKDTHSTIEEETTVINTFLGNYVAIIYYIEEMVKTDKFNIKNIKEFIEKCKSYPSLQVTAGMANQAVE